MLALTPPVLGSAVTFPSLSVWDLKRKTEKGGERKRGRYSLHQKEFQLQYNSAVLPCSIVPSP